MLINIPLTDMVSAGGKEFKGLGVWEFKGLGAAYR